jgi:IS30 family transposase
MYYHLTQQQRIELSLMTRLGYSQRSVALVLGVNPSTVCRELQRNIKPCGQYFPKGYDLGKITQAELDHVVKFLNTRPRKRLGYKTPEQVFESKW